MQDEKKSEYRRQKRSKKSGNRTTKKEETEKKNGTFDGSVTVQQTHSLKPPFVAVSPFSLV